MFAFLFLGGALILHFLVPSVSVSAESASLRKDIMDTDIAAESALDVEMLAVKPPAEDSQPASSAKGVSIDIVDVRVTLQTSTSWTGSNDADETDRTILRGVSAHIEGGQFLVILGGSGSGKSTLLNIMAGRADPSLHTQGEILIGGRPLAQCGATIGYVMQADYLIPTLTVRETLNYAAALRLPSTMSDVERTQRVEEVIADLGLSECANTRVGDDDERGISGGERRRTSIAIQLLSEPAVLLCDEPTSGLDSTSAYHLMRTLRRLATEKHRTVVASIHQPRSDVYSLFDDIMLLSRGELIYVGRAGDHILQYFQSLGHNCPAFFNPSDWVLDLSSVDLRHPTVEAESRARVLELAKAYQKSNVCAERTAIVNQAAAAAKQLALAPGDASSGPSASFSKAFPVLVSRSMTHFSRSPIIISARIFQTLSYALILALYFAPMSNDQRYIQNRLGLLQQYTGLLFVGMLNCLAVFINERNVFWRERADGAYETAPFFLSYLAGELPFEIVGSLVYALLVGPVVGMGHSPSQYFVTAYIVFCIITSGESFGILFCAFIQHAGFAVSLVNALLSTFTIMAGFLAFSMPAGIKTINYISLLRYTSRLNAVYEFRGQPITCLPDQITAGVCPITSGSQVLELYGFDASVSAETLDWVMSAVLVIVYRLIAFLALKYNRSRFAA
jgi:ABC-type multidrug transport system ATPase subunit